MQLLWVWSEHVTGLADNHSEALLLVINAAKMPAAIGVEQFLEFGNLEEVEFAGFHEAD